MIRKMSKRLAFLAILSSLVLSAMACVGFSSQEQQVQVLQPTVVIQQVVTQVVAEATSVPPAAAQAPQQPGAAAAQPADPVSAQDPGSTRQRLANTFDPLGVDIYYPLKGCVASRLHVGEKAFVAYHNQTLTLLQTPDLGDAPIRRHMQPGEIVSIIDGPYCDMGALLWRVTASDGEDGYMAEGDGSTYWLFPLGEKLRQKAKPETASVEPAAYQDLQRLGLPSQCLPR